jgi:hypothetical protein
MATYSEIRDLFTLDDLKNKVTTATLISAYNLLSGTPTTSDKLYADSVFANPSQEALKVFMAVLASNKDNSVAQISGASDAAIQSAVDTVIPFLVDAKAGA